MSSDDIDSVSGSSDSSLQSVLSTLYNLVDLSESDLSEEDLDPDFACQYIKDLVVSCPN